MSVVEAQVFAMIFNIPSVYHSSSLRNFFKELIDVSGFQVFHYRHRPMQKQQQQEQHHHEHNNDGTQSHTTPSESHLATRPGRWESNSISSLRVILSTLIHHHGLVATV